jgi:glycosyltransferase involved in cell wall biosynthesis
MKVLVYPHDLNMGGSQLNAIELAAAVTALGHECVVYGRPGALCDRVAELGLEFIESPDPGRRPSPRVVRDLRGLVRARGIDVVHGYEWPPGLEAGFAALGEDGPAAVCTVMSMAVAPFLPYWLPLVVGTRQIAANELARGRTAVHLLEPPVDLDHNRAPGAEELAAFRERWHLDGRPVVACVGRLVSELKAEGVLTAIRVAGELAASSPFQLLLVGDGAARPVVEAAARSVNDRAGANTVVLTGELADPRPAYAVAAVCLGMGGSALRALAFAKPLVVQGERGFFETLTPDSVEQFRWQGWYGVGADAAEGPARLAGQLAGLLADPVRRAELGGYGGELVREYSLSLAARHQVDIYSAALAASRGGLRAVPETVRAGGSFAAYHLARRVARLRGRGRTDDFNARPVAAQDGPRGAGSRDAGDASGPIVYLPGVTWDAVPGTDRQLVTALARHREVIWSDPPVSVLRERGGPGTLSPEPNVTRLRTVAPPGVTRPVLSGIARRLQVRRLRRHLASAGLTPAAVVASSSEGILGAVRRLPGTKVYLATDDFEEAAELWGMPRAHLAAARETNLAVADLVLAVTPALARDLRRGPREPVWFPNGADLDRYRGIASARVAPGIRLAGPLAGVVGQFNERTDLSLLRAVADAGIGLLLVGPRTFATEQAAQEFAELAAGPSVQWVDRVPSGDLPGYFAALGVGLTAYRDNRFNRRSYPLKTVEYLAAGVPVVTTRVAPLDGLDQRFVACATGPDEFVAAVRAALAARPAAADVQASVAGHGWDDRAGTLLGLITGGGGDGH